MVNQERNLLTDTSINRRSLIKRAGVFGLSLPAAGMLLNACGSNDNVDSRLASATAAASERQAAAVPVQSIPVTELTIVGKDIFFEPNALEVPAGGLVRLTFVNEGVMEHDWEVTDLTTQDLTVLSEPDGMTARMTERLSEAKSDGFPYAGAPAGAEMVIEFTAEQPGSYEMLCVVPGHKEAGMVGTFTVTGEGAAYGDEDEDADADPHAVPATDNATGTPYDAPRLPNPDVAPPVGKREPQLIKQEIEIQEVVGYVDDGVAFDFWTFGGTIPGPMVRVRVGDTVELTLKNPAESKATHNIDFHSATGPGGGAAATVVAPGQSATIKFKAMNPGVFVYHCAVAPIPHHISAGMYGLMVVEPEEGLPPVDKEFYVMQGDLYMEGARGEKGLRGFSMDKMLDERPDYVTLNGAVGALTGDNSFKANVGETVRIFFGVGGPNLVSSFHVIGEIFDRVMVEGASEWATNIQTTLVPAGGATIVDFKVEVPGTLIMVDHSLGRLHKGCVGMIEVEGDENPDVFEVISEPG
jgi:nitrite reductase (NO-forming)